MNRWCGHIFPWLHCHKTYWLYRILQRIKNFYKYFRGVVDKWLHTLRGVSTKRLEKSIGYTKCQFYQHLYSSFFMQKSHEQHLSLIFCGLFICKLACIHIGKKWQFSSQKWPFYLQIQEPAVQNDGTYLPQTTREPWTYILRFVVFLKTEIGKKLDIEMLMNQLI